MIPGMHHEVCVCGHCRCGHFAGYSQCLVGRCGCGRYTWPGYLADVPADHTPGASFKVTRKGVKEVTR